MRVDWAALGQAIVRGTGTGPAFAAKAAATGGAVLAAATILYVVWPQADEAPVDAVVSAAPVFTPVTWKPAVATPAMAAPFSASDDGAAGRATDMRDPASVTRAVQRHLKRAGCYDGPVNGRWTARTRHGMAAFTDSVNARLPVDGPDTVLLVLLETHAEVSCRDEPPGSTAARQPEETASIAPRAEPAREVHEPRRAEPIAAMDEAPPETGASNFEGEAAAAVAAAPAVRKVVRADRPRASKRKYRRSPSVSRSFRKLQRSVSRLFF